MSVYQCIALASLLSYLLLSQPTFSQKNKGVNPVRVEEIKASYIRIFESKTWSSSSYIIDWGQPLKEIKGQVIVNVKGVAIRFNGIMDFINHMATRGWELYLIDNEHHNHNEKVTKYYYMKKRKIK